MTDDYIRRRRENQEHWAARAQHHGMGTDATASVPWVREGTVRCLRALVQPTDRVLEVGCGNGNLLDPIGRHCYAVGVDLTMEMLKVAKEQTRTIRALARADAVSLPFQDKSFDIVYTSRCLINVQDRGMQTVALREIFRVVKSGGTVVLSENFEEPVDRLNRVKARAGSGAPVRDSVNLRLNLQDTLEYCLNLGWEPVRIRGYPLSSFTAEILIPRVGYLPRGRIWQRVLAPTVNVAARLDGPVSRWLPHFGKDTTITLSRVDGLRKTGR